MALSRKRQTLLESLRESARWHNRHAANILRDHAFDHARRTEQQQRVDQHERFAEAIYEAVKILCRPTKKPP